MARKPANKPDAVDASTDGNNARSFRLNDEQRAEILRMHAEGRRKADIAEAIGTTVATVGRTINAATGTMPTRRSDEAPAASGVSETQRRLIAFAVATLMGDTVEDGEKDALRAVLQQRIEDARRKATEEALRSL